MKLASYKNRGVAKSEDECCGVASGPTTTFILPLSNA